MTAARTASKRSRPERLQRMPGRTDSAYKRLQRFLQTTDSRCVLLRLFQSDAPFVIGDPTDMPCTLSRQRLRESDRRLAQWLAQAAVDYDGPLTRAQLGDLSGAHEN